MNYIVFNGAEQGKPHVASNLECQDVSFSKIYAEESIYIIANADGHGSYKYFRSKIGAQYAVNIASQLLYDFAMEHVELPSENLIKSLEKCIVEKWKKMVIEHFKLNPVSENELKRFPNKENIFDIDAVTTYGSTLIAAVLTPNYLLVIHIGDGRVVVLHDDGTINQPVPWDSDCLENITTSLCMLDSVNKFRHYLLDLKIDRIIGIYLTSDGLEDIQPMAEALNGFFANLSLLVEHNPNEFLSTGLDYFLKVNNIVDDVSIACILDIERVSYFNHQYKVISKRDYTNYEELIYYIKDRIRSKKLGIQYLVEDIEDLKKNCNKNDSLVLYNFDKSKTFDLIKKSFVELFSKIVDSPKKYDHEMDIKYSMNNLYSYICEEECKSILLKYNKELQEKRSELEKLEKELLNIKEKLLLQRDVVLSSDKISFDS